MNVQLPTCIRAWRIGWGESEYGLDGLLAPITWLCACGARLQLERLTEDDIYVPVARKEKDQFLAEHSNCTITCWKCGTAEVDEVGYWCTSCSDSEE